MHDRYDDRYRSDPYSSGRGFGRDRNFLERAGEEVRSWFGRDETDRPRAEERDRHRYESERYREHPDYGWAADRSSTRDWTPDRWERTDRWSGERGERKAGYGATAAASRTWDDRDDRFVAPGDYREWTRQGWGGTSRPTEPRGIYEDDRGRVYQFAHTDDFVGRGPKGYRRSDERIREDVCDRLTMDPHVDPSEMEVVVNNAEVTLSGVVNSRGEKRRAEDVIEQVSGVREVHNNLRVNRQG